MLAIISSIISTAMFVTLFCSAAWAEQFTGAAVAYVLKNYTMQQSEKEVFFDPEKIQSTSKYAVINSAAFFADGSSTDYFIEDISFVLCLEKRLDWSVVCDLSRSDVPSAEELKYIKKSFPVNFPKELLPNYWQKLLGTLKN